MRRHWVPVALMSAVVACMTITGCTKRAATSAGWTAPAPAATSGADGPRTAGPGAANPAGTDRSPNVQNAGADPRQAALRPSVKGFAPASDLVDVYFELDRHQLQPAQTRVLDSNARWLRSTRDLVLIEGHCDERGTGEYNLALGERRATSALNYLVSQGVARSRISIVSYGKERPQCTERTESCWKTNRRAHFVVKRD